MLALSREAELKELEKLRKNNSSTNEVVEKTRFQKKQLWESEINPQKIKQLKKIVRTRIRRNFDSRLREVYSWPNEKIKKELARIHSEMVKDKKLLTPQEREVVHISAFFFQPIVHPKAKLKAAKLIVKYVLKRI